MKRFGPVILALLVLLTGCAQDIPVGTTQPTTLATTAPSVRAQGPRLLAEDLPGVLETIQAGADRCLVVRDDPKAAGSVAMVYDLEGNVLGHRNLEFSGSDAVILEGGLCAFMEWSSLDIQVWNPELTRMLWSRSGVGLKWGQLWSHGCFYGITREGDALRVDLGDGSSTAVRVGEALSGLSACDGTRSLAECLDGEGNLEYFWLDWETQALSPADVKSCVTSAVVKTGLEQTRDAENLLLRKLGQEDVYVLPLEQDLRIVDVDEPQGLALLRDSTGGLLVWELEWGRTWLLPGVDTWSGCVEEGNVFYTAAGSTGTDVYLWSYADREPAERRGTVWTRKDLERENRADAAQIHRNTGMEVYYGTEGILFSDLGDSGYVGRVEVDLLAIHLGLKELVTFTEQYPAGIFQEMLVEPVKEMALYLTGTLTPTGDNSIATAAAFTTTLGQTRILVANLEYAADSLFFRQTLAHEFMHAMEDRIFACEQERGIPYLNYWESFSPGPDAYCYSYFNAQGLELSDPTYTAGSDLPPEEVSFLDAYSRSYPHEDRARILEYLYAGETSTYAYLYRDGKVREKARYLCAVIRECFPSCREARRLPWETMVDQVPFARYAQAVMSYQPVAKG